MRAALICVVALGLVYQVSSECANACSGHGVCRNSDQCDCFPNYMAADCSERVCPYGLAWVDNPNGDLDHDGSRIIGTTSADNIPIYTFTNGDSGVVPGNAAGTVTVKQWETYNPEAQDNEGHFYAECSNKGLCDRSAGLCVCFDGYTGSSCQRTTCPNDCSGNGVCRTVAEVAAGNLNNSVAAGSSDFTTKWGGLNRRQIDNRAGKRFYEGMYTPTLYRLWDADMAQTCVCDPGFSGPDCSQRECPRGDDPLTHRFAECPRLTSADARYTASTPCVNEVQTILIGGTANTGADWFHLLFKDWTGKIWKTDDFLIGLPGTTSCSAAGGSTLPLFTGATTAYNSVDTAVKNALESIPNDIIGSVSVTAKALTTGNSVSNGAVEVGTGTTPVNGNAGPAAFDDDYGYLIQITFTSNPGNLYALQVVNSLDMQVNLPACLSAEVTAPAVDFIDAAVVSEFDGNKELSTCSNRGVCDYTSGLCKCFKGYYGGDCSMQNALSQ